MANYPVYTRALPPPQVGSRNDEPTMTQQHFTAECDVNNILAKFVRTGILDTIGPGTYEDVSDSLDYLTALQTIQRANEVFEALPSKIRAEFQNDPAQYLAFVEDSSNLERGIELGIFTKNATKKELSTETKEKPAEAV